MTEEFTNQLTKLSSFQPHPSDLHPTSLLYELTNESARIYDHYGNEVIMTFQDFHVYLSRIAGILRSNGYRHLVSDGISYYLKYDDAFICYLYDDGLSPSLVLDADR